MKNKTNLNLVEELTGIESSFDKVLSLKEKEAITDEIKSLKNMQNIRKDETLFLLNSTRKKKVAFVIRRLPMATNKKFAHLLLISSMCKKIFDIKKYSIKVFFHGDYNANKNEYEPLPKAYQNHLKDVLGPQIDSYITTKENPYILSNISDFDPDVIFYLGGAFESKKIRLFLYDYFPTCFLFFNQNNKVDNKIDVAISNKVFKVNGDLPKERFKQLNLPIATFTKDIEYSVSQIKVIDDEITIACALTNDRIGKIFSQYTDKQLDQFFKLFDTFLTLRLVLLGPSNADFILSIDSRFQNLFESNRLHIIEFELHLRSYLSHCDLFVAFPGFDGGGTGGVMARLEKCPVLCYKGSDVCAKEVPTLIEDDEGKFYETLISLIQNKNLRMKRAEQQYKYLNDNFLSIEPKRFNYIVNYAQESFNTRNEFI
ncbi:hypothetical protein [Psychromonas arctica]|uniref:hypothetical protein n=1 Tax=Psychromonas arctica TaxID=168275 RepID=UPI002FD1E75E